jgi:DNA-binding response OmpR family regulator
MPENKRILFVEDDEIIASGLCYTFEAEGYGVLRCGTVKAALEAIAHEAFDIAVLDLSLPDGSGFALCEAIKAKRRHIPVIFLTAVDDEANTVRGLEMGADDYIAKPFRIRELLARVNAALRRNTPSGETKDPDVIHLGDIKLFTAEARMEINGKEAALTAQEYRLLMLFARNRGRILSRERLLEALWDSAGEFVNDNTLTVSIKRLREKLGDDGAFIETVRGLGYRMMREEKHGQG